MSRAERSRWPGSEVRIAFASDDADTRPEVGASGYFSPHETGDQERFDAWAGAIDLPMLISSSAVPQQCRLADSHYCKNKMFTPHLLVVPVGSSMAFPKTDPFFHNVF